MSIQWKSAPEYGSQAAYGNFLFSIQQLVLDRMLQLHYFAANALFHLIFS